MYDFSQIQKSKFMRKLNILLVEDEPLIADDLALTLEEIGYAIAGVCMSGEEALDTLKEKPVDLVLLDINLDGDIDGIEVAETILDKFSVPFIYLTSYSDEGTLTRAKATNPLAYLVKPINEKDLLTTIEIALSNFEKNQDTSPKQKSSEDTIFIKESYTFYKIKIKDILYAEAHDNYCFVYTQAKKFLINLTLKVLEERLSAWNFARVHRSFLVNPEVISKIDDGYIYINKITIPISKKYKKSFIENLDVL